MATLNKVMLIGRLTKNPDPERTIPSTGTTVVSFRLAVGRSRKDPETGEWKNDPNPLYIDCEVFSGRDGSMRLVDLVKNYLRQGSEVYVEGRLQYDEWDNRETGKKQSKHKVVVSEIQFVGARSEGGGHGMGHDEDDEGARPSPPPRRAAPAAATRSNGPAPRASKPAPPSHDDMGGADDDIPF